MRTDELDFELPAELIAQLPTERREDSRLLHYKREDGVIRDGRFSELPDLLQPGDLLVMNASKVIPARFYLRKSTGGLIEGLFLSERMPGEWSVMLRDLGATGEGTVLTFDADPSIRATVGRNLGRGEFLLGVSANETAVDLLNRIGRMPLPPYVKREKRLDSRDELDRERYQTVYAAAPGSVAAPTAGLHFTRELLAQLDLKGVERVTVTLHVGAGTFKPIDAATLDAHQMHSENYSIDAPVAEAINRATRERQRIIAVGTTSARVLESQPDDKPVEARSGSTDIFIYPPYRWKFVDALITNFHLPRSTLIALVAAKVGLEEQRRIYRHAINLRYRFFSYGDAMFIE